MGLTIDSSVLIAGERRNHSILQILEQVQAIHGQVDIGLSVVTIAELIYGAYRAAVDTTKQRRLSFVNRLCSDVPVYPFNIEIARKVGRVEVEQAVTGVAIPFEDLVIGATALHLGFDVMTHNLRHFRHIPGLTVVSA